MAGGTTTQALHLAKLHRILNAIRDEAWSVNRFQEAFYASEDQYISNVAANNLRYRPNWTFGAEKIIRAMIARTPTESKPYMKKMLADIVSDFLVDESTKAIKNPALQRPSTKLKVADLSEDFALPKILEVYRSQLPLLCFILRKLMTADNTYEKEQHRQKADKHVAAERALLVVISILLFKRNRATNFFQIVFGIFATSSGTSRRMIDVLNQMGLSVSFDTIGRGLTTLTADANDRAVRLMASLAAICYVVYDNLNFTLRKASQTLMNITEQLNVTTLALVALPSRFTHATHGHVLSEEHRFRGQRANMTLHDVSLTTEQHTDLFEASVHQVKVALADHAPSLRPSSSRSARRKRILQHIKQCKPRKRTVGHEKTVFMPMSAIDQEEASVIGTLRVVDHVHNRLLKITVAFIEATKRLFVLVGDWLTIRNLRLMQEERAHEFSRYQRMDWVQEAAMPFHFQINATHMIIRTHLGHDEDNDPASLEQHRVLLRRYKLDPQKPVYDKARQLIRHSLIARLLDCLWVILELESVDDLKNWKPSVTEFDRIARKLVDRFGTSRAGHDALERGDEWLAHSIFFIRDALMYLEFAEAVKDGDVGRMWLIYEVWTLAMRGAGLHNYGGELLEMKAQYKFEFTPSLSELMENTWLVNRWGKEGRSIPTDLYLEHNNGFMKVMIAARGSNASMKDLEHKSSATVEVLRTVSHAMTGFFGLADYHRQATEVDYDGDLRALCLDLKDHKIHEFDASPHRRIPPKPTKSKRKPKNASTTGVRDVIEDGWHALTQKKRFEQWKARSLRSVTGGRNMLQVAQPIFEEEDDPEDFDYAAGTAFAATRAQFGIDIEQEGGFGDEYGDESAFGFGGEGRDLPDNVDDE